MSCSAVSCSSRTITKEGVKDPDVSFHTFPKCPERRREWIRAVGLHNWEPNKYSRLCSKHFDKSCYITGLSRKILRTDAVPTIFEGYLAYYRAVGKKRKQRQRRDEIKYITIRKPKRSQEIGVNTGNIPTTPARVVRVLKSLAKSQKVALKRLKTIKKLREYHRRLLNKNAALLGIIRNLQSKSNLDKETLD